MTEIIIYTQNDCPPCTFIKNYLSDKAIDYTEKNISNSKFRNEMMDYDAFCKMKERAIFINVARGPIVDEKDLAKAIHKGKIAAAGLDVLEQEPMDKDCPLRKLEESDRLLITPHIAWAAVEARTRLLDEVWLNLNAYIQGEERNVCRK